MDHWRQEYEFIVIDTPPVALFSDALAVATQVDSVLTLSRANRTSARAFGDMIKRLAATRAMVLGAVINHF
jgi:Mrp family chromosome partitioning ATPase